MQVNLSGKVALVTGSTKGIGRDVALALAKNGADVALNGRRPGPVEEVLAQVQALGRRAIFERADIFEYAEVERMVAKVIERMGRVDLLVVSGGSLDKVPGNYFLETPPESYLDYAKGQWLSRLYCFRAVAQHMVERSSGKVIFFGTDAGRWPTPGVCLPGGSGAALVMSTKVLAQEFARHQIRINTISTTVTENTPGLEDVLVARAASKVFEKAMKRQPFKVRSDDLANAALYLASEESNAITGQTLSVNGGLCFPG
jgi:2-hydroxycyclohexanecarboxyl-CoA dehydrogenase